MVNLSKNGLVIHKRFGESIKLQEIDRSCVLSSPSVVWCQEIPIYFQLFSISETEIVEQPPTTLRETTANNPHRTLGQLVELALEEIPDHRASYSQIISYLSDHFSEELKDRPSWKQSISAVLSNSPLFIGGAAIHSGKKSRSGSSGSMWYLKRMFSELEESSKQAK